jgi:hypothetical protein
MRRFATLSAAKQHRQLVIKRMPFLLLSQAYRIIRGFYKLFVCKDLREGVPRIAAS